MKKIAFLGSDGGETFEAVVNYFNFESSSVDVEITCLSNNLNSDILKRAKDLNIKHRYLPFEENAEYFASHNYDLIALAKYKKTLPENVVTLGKFVNIHPSLLPAFKGDDAAARAFSSGVKVSGVTVHRLANESGGGKIIAQYPVLIGNLMHFDEFENAIQNLENVLYPIVIEKILEDKVFDFTDLFGSCSGGCSGGCGGCNH